ncbi:MAG: hypothetical protein ACP6IY_14745 [Promethearchaeia archaeon]
MIVETTLGDLFINAIPFLVSFSLVVLLFGFLLYFAVYIWNIKDKSEDFDKNFLIRSLFISFVAALVVILMEFLFVFLLLFSPYFKSGFNFDLMASILSTSIIDIIFNIFSSPPFVLGMFIIFFAAIVIFNSLIMLGIYKVSYLWTTIVTWTAIGIYLGLDLLIHEFIIENGFAGVFKIIGDSIYNALK